MIVETDFRETSIAHGLVMGEFDHLSDDDKQKLIGLMAGIMEMGYRRGVQQAHALNEEKRNPELNDQSGLAKWRFETPVSESIGIDGFKSSSIERLFMEHGVLRELGFWEGK